MRGTEAPGFIRGERHTGNDSIVRHASEVDHNVYVIFNTLDAVRFEANFLVASRHLNSRLPDNVALLVLVKGRLSLFLEIMDRVLRPLMVRMMKNQRVASSLDEAYDLIKENMEQQQQVQPG